MTTNDTQDRDGIIGGALTVALLITLAVQNAVPPMATDMYSAAFPQITADLATNSTMLGFTLTTFFVGYATGQVLGGAISDQIGRRRPIIAGGIIALVGSIICVLTPNISSAESSRASAAAWPRRWRARSSSTSRTARPWRAR